MPAVGKQSATIGLPRRPPSGGGRRPGPGTSELAGNGDDKVAHGPGCAGYGASRGISDQRQRLHTVRRSQSLAADGGETSARPYGTRSHWDSDRIGRIQQAEAAQLKGEGDLQVFFTLHYLTCGLALTRGCQLLAVRSSPFHDQTSHALPQVSSQCYLTKIAL